MQDTDDERLSHKRLEVEQARYEVVRAQRQYDAVDPTNRLVAGTLERRWNDTMKLQSQREEELAELVRAATLCAQRCDKNGLDGAGR